MWKPKRKIHIVIEFMSTIREGNISGIQKKNNKQKMVREW